MRAVAVLLVAGCTGDAGVPHPTDDRNGLRVQLAVEADTEAVQLSTLGLRVDEVVLEASGPMGPVSLSVTADLGIVLVGAATGDFGVTLDLPAGVYRDVVLDVHLRERGGDHALWSTGALTSDSDRDVPFDLEVRPGLTLTAAGEVQVGEGPDPVVWVELRPSRWFDGVETGGVGAVLRLEPQSGEDYDRVVERIVDSATFDFPGAF